MCERSEQLAELVGIVVEQGKDVLEAYNRGVDAKTKADGTYLTETDERIGRQLKKRINVVYGRGSISLWKTMWDRARSSKETSG